MDQEIDFDAFVNAVREVNLEEEQVHEAAHSSAVSTRTWERISDESQD